MSRFLRAALGVLLVGLLGEAESPREDRTIDLGPRQGWSLEGRLMMRVDNRFALSQDGDGIAWKFVELDLDRYPILLVRAGNSLPRERWRILVQKGRSQPSDVGQAIGLLDCFALEGGFIAPLRKITGWSGQVGFTLIVSISGRKGDCLEFDALEAVRMEEEIPRPPRLIAPANDSSLSALAVHYCWHEVPGALEYDLQISKQSDFSGARPARISPQYLTDRIPYLPPDEELPPPGRWFWRVRAINFSGRPGEWSAPAAFDVRPAAPSDSPPALSVSPARPLIILCSDERNLTANWSSLPAELKPHTVFRVEALPAENLVRVARVAEANRIPIIIQTSGPHDDYGRTSSRIALAEVEETLQHFAFVKGVYICEQAFRVLPARDRIMRDYARRLVSVAAEHGRIVFWADGHWGRNLWLDVGLDRDLMSAIQTHPGHFVPLWKMNCSLTPFSIHSAVLGFWLSRAVDNWGVQPERWYWYEAGFRKLGRQAWFKQGTMEDFPPAFYGQMILLGLASGASVYSFEPGGDTWNQAGGASAISRQVVFPFLSFILERGLVPERAEILKKVCCAYVAEKEDSAWALDYSTLKESYKALYGIAHPFQMIPTSSRFYLLPILSRWTPAAILESFPGRWDRRRSADPKVGRSRALRKPAERFRGDAWVVSLPRAVLAMNSRENKDVDQSFDLEFAGAIRRLRGDLSVNSYFVGLDSGGEFRGLLNGRAGKSVTLTMWCRAQPKEIHVAPEASLKKSLWLESKNRLILIFSLAQETIDVKLSFAGNQAGGGEVGIDFPADSNSGGGLTTERRKNA